MLSQVLEILYRNVMLIRLNNSTKHFVLFNNELARFQSGVLLVITYRGDRGELDPFSSVAFTSPYLNVKL